MAEGRPNRLRKRIAELRPCANCGGTDGLWVFDEAGNAKRCACIRGQLLAKLDGAKQKSQKAEVEAMA